MQSKKVYDLEERTTEFSKNIILFVQKINKNPVTTPLISQLVRSGTSIGANYCEADDAESKRDFVHKIAICKKESRETKYWLTSIKLTVNVNKDEIEALFQEAKELHLIFSSIINSAKKNDNIKNK